MKKNLFGRIIGAALSVCMAFGSAGLTVFAEELEDVDTIMSDDADLTEDGEASDADADTDGGEQDNFDGEAPAVEDDNAVAGGFDSDYHEVTLPARSIRLKVSQTNNIEIGKTFQIKYAFTPLKSDDYVTYRNFNKSVVKVDQDGLVTAVGYGEAKVQLETSGGRKKNVYFVVTGSDGDVEAEPERGEVTDIEFADSFIMLRAGKSFKTDVIYYPLGLYADLTYSSSDTSVARVSADGKITGVSAGSAVITARTENGVKTEMSVTVYDDILRGIDVSKWQGNIDWKKVSVSGVDFVMIRSSFGSEHTDEMLDRNVKGCEKYGIPYGFYHYTYATTPAEARREAKYFLKQIKDYNPEYPIVLDIEESFYKEMSRKQVTDIIVAFMEVVENAGYYGMVYNSPNFIKACINEKTLKKYDIWIACWGDEDRLAALYDGHYGIWQYSSTGRVNGINGDVDLDYSYKDYASIIRKGGYNNL
ncbi:MAG: Ig-like domain-containing protein [Oscillospiraceae bacterium]|nr:Ig-like domain-containing protein [Oscillospiraceae bacterium]